MLAIGTASSKSAIGSLTAIDDGAGREMGRVAPPIGGGDDGERGGLGGGSLATNEPATAVARILRFFRGGLLPRRAAMVPAGGV